MLGPDNKRFAFVMHRYDDEDVYMQWTNGPTTVSRWCAHAIRTVKGLRSAYIIDLEHGHTRKYSLTDFRKAFSIRT